MIAADPARVIAAARGWLGTPYHHQASVKGAGCDCLGLARGIWREVVGQEPVAVPAYSPDWGETGRREVLLDAARALLTEVPVAAAGPGALLLFRMDPRAIAKHLGVLCDGSARGGRFIHAYDRLGVIEQSLTLAWQRRIAFAFVFPARAAGELGTGGAG